MLVDYAQCCKMYISTSEMPVYSLRKSIVLFFVLVWFLGNLVRSFSVYTVALAHKLLLPRISSLS